jgi:hypothetical protein
MEERKKKKKKEESESKKTVFIVERSKATLPNPFICANQVVGKHNLSTLSSKRQKDGIKVDTMNEQWKTGEEKKRV